MSASQATICSPFTFHLCHIQNSFLLISLSELKVIWVRNYTQKLYNRIICKAVDKWVLGGAEAPPNFLAFVFEGYNVDREMFTLKIIRVKNFHGVKFSRFVRSANFF